MRPLRPLLLALLPLLLLAGGAAAQQAVDRPLRVFLDCADFRCDDDFLTQEIPWVDFVRDRQVADVHVLGTRQSTGAGGSAYTIDFQGRDGFDGQHLTLRATTLPDATDSDRRRELLRVIRLGLAPFATATARAPEAEFFLPEGVAEQVGTVEDPWNRWVFRVAAEMWADGESQQSSLNTAAEVSASRVTPAWKLMLSGEGSVDRDEYTLEGETEEFVRESYEAEGLAVKSIGPRWGVGAIGEWQRSTYNNYQHSAAVALAVEHNIFPYEESTRRLLTLLYAIGPRVNVYEDTTIFGETEETLIEQMVVASYEVTQPWGEVDVAARLTHYVAKFGDGDDWPDPQYNGSVFGRFEVRILQGLSAEAHGSFSMVRGQVQLSAEELSDEEVLTQQRELKTDYRYRFSVGLSYRFGSIFSDVVNPRFEGL